MILMTPNKYIFHILERNRLYCIIKVNCQLLILIIDNKNIICNENLKYHKHINIWYFFNYLKYIHIYTDQTIKSQLMRKT
jgi:hypothetical protein